MSRRAEQDVAKIKPDRHPEEQAQHQNTAENGVRLVKENEKHLLKAARRLARDNVKTSFQEAVWKLKHSVCEPEQYADEGVVENVIRVVRIKEVQAAELAQGANQTPEDLHEHVEYNIAEQAFVGFVVAKEPFPVA